MLPKLLKREHRSAIVDLSSSNAFAPRATAPIYGGTKNYNYALSAANRQAYADKIDVMTVHPASVKTNMNLGYLLFTVQPVQHGKAVIDQLGR